MNSVIFRTAAGVILPIMLVLSFIVLLRGHNEPGGGFVGGLLAASGFALLSLSHGSASALRRLGLHPRTYIGIGLLTATLSGLPAMLTGRPFLSGVWTTITLPGFPEPLKIGTPLFFDIGVYLLVLGGVLLMTFTLKELSDVDVARG